MGVLTCYSLAPKLGRLLQWYLEYQSVVPKSVRYYGRPFKMGIVVTQGVPVSPTLFNIVFDSVVKVVPLEVCFPQEAHHRLCWASGEHKIVIYVDDGRKSGLNPIWIKKTLTERVNMLDKASL